MAGSEQNQVPLASRNGYSFTGKRAGDGHQAESRILRCALSREWSGPKKASEVCHKRLRARGKGYGSRTFDPWPRQWAHPYRLLSFGSSRTGGYNPGEHWNSIADRFGIAEIKFKDPLWQRSAAMADEGNYSASPTFQRKMPATSVFVIVSWSERRLSVSEALRTRSRWTSARCISTFASCSSSRMYRTRRTLVNEAAQSARTVAMLKIVAHKTVAQRSLIAPFMSHRPYHGGGKLTR